MWVLPRADCGSLPTAGITGSRNSTTWPTSRWAPSPSHLRMRTSSTSAPGSPTTGRVRRSATGSGAPQMAARRGTIWAWKIRSRLGALWWIRRTPTWSTWWPWGSWNHLGLEDTQSIGRIVVDPTNPNVVYVVAMGHLFGPNAERGLFKSVDGGKTWKKSKYIDTYTGFTDVAIDPVNPKTLYAASNQRLRTWWGYNGGGPGSGLWKTTDGGDTWSKLEGSGWPKAKDGLYGRIALSIFRAKPSTIYAQVEVGAGAGTGGGTEI